LFTLVAVTASASSDSLAAGTRTYTSASGICMKVEGSATPAATVALVDTQTAAGTTSDVVVSVQPHLAGAGLRGWMSSTLGNHGARKGVELVRFDPSNWNVIAAETLDPTYIQQIDLPALDAGSDNTPPWTVRLATTSSRTTPAQGTFTCGSPSERQKKWFSNAFRVQIDGLDMSRVAKAEPVIVRSSLLTRVQLLNAEAFRPRGTTAATSTTTISNLVLTTATSGNTLPGLQQWLAGGAAPRNGAIVYLALNLTETLCTTRLTGLTIRKITVDSATSQARVEMTVGGLQLTCP